MDIHDALVVLGVTVFVLGLVIVHPALLIVLIGYLAFSHGLNRSR